MYLLTLTAFTNISRAQDVLRAYASVRQPRAQKVWESSRRAGDIYDSRAGYEGIRLEELQTFWHSVWYYPLNEGFEAAESILVKEGVFSKP